jgi:hypothetical protein
MSNGPTKREREAAIFRAFIAAKDDFAGGPISVWIQPDSDPPDVLCRTATGKVVGVELKTWVNEKQVREAKTLEARQDAIRDALAPQPPNTSAHIAFVWLTVTDRSLRSTEATSFKDELLGFLAGVEAAWPENGAWDGLGGYWRTSFPRWPILARHISTVKIFPRAHFEPRGNVPRGDRTDEWIIFQFRASSYSEREMMDPLEDLLAEAWTKYETTRKDKALDELDLLIHYDDLAWANCTPVETADFDFETAAKEVRAYLQDIELLGEKLDLEKEPPFDRVFLFVALEGIASERVFQLR